MDTSAPPKRSIRADITRKYEERVAATTAKTDPHRAKAREQLGDIDGFELENFNSSITAPKSAPPQPTTSYLNAPLLTLPQLMPGSTGKVDDNDELDQSFRADKIEFLVIQRKLLPDEVQQDPVIQEVGDVDWEVPTQEEYEDLMGQVVDVFTDENQDLVQALKRSSVDSSTGVGCFSVGTGNLAQINDIRGILRTIIHQGQCFELFPKRAMVMSFSLTAFFPRSTKYVGVDKFVYWLFLCNRGLQGTIWPAVSKKFPDDHPNQRKQGARILSFMGDQKFLDSLHAFPRGYPFSIKIANVVIEGGDRTKEGRPVIRRRRPRMTEEALKNLLRRHGKEILEDAEENQDQHSYLCEPSWKENLKRKILTTRKEKIYLDTCLQTLMIPT